MLQHVFLEIISLDGWIVALVEFGHLGKILIYDLRIQRVLKAPVNWYSWKEQVDLARAISWKVKVARYNDDNDDDDDDGRNIYLRNEYL